MATNTQSHFAPYLKHRGKTVEEQIKLNQPALAWLRKRLEEEITQEEAKIRQEDLEKFKQIVDIFRPEGSKLYS
ncbi:hypothetical protein BJP36_22100 [Moorena producens JHB]|uniref:Uncharacterized protein n=1 Tax=Moorena producens (strain JHB) TaxID=1454205 RepID=A0A1D9G3U8_MOOP1|nr:hypothetical protein [Moorena producens]AOY82195.1 hypothetical protein BJP36_22100 [Moorena producens JHB]